MVAGRGKPRSQGKSSWSEKVEKICRKDHGNDWLGKQFGDLKNRVEAVLHGHCHSVIRSPIFSSIAERVHL